MVILHKSQWYVKQESGSILSVFFFCNSTRGWHKLPSGWGEKVNNNNKEKTKQKHDNKKVQTIKIFQDSNFISIELQ